MSLSILSCAAVAPAHAEVSAADNDLAVRGAAESEGLASVCDVVLAAVSPAELLAPTQPASATAIKLATAKILSISIHLSP